MNSIQTDNHIYQNAYLYFVKLVINPCSRWRRFKILAAIKQNLWSRHAFKSPLIQCKAKMKATVSVPKIELLPAGFAKLIGTYLISPDLVISLHGTAWSILCTFACGTTCRELQMARIILGASI
jgi:hypothetical protein